MNHKIIFHLSLVVTSLSILCQAAGEPEDPFIKGVNLFYYRCGACHPVIPPSKNGPHLYGIVGRYRMEFPDSAAFRESIIKVVENPESNSIMTREIKKFRVMPKRNIDKTEISAIASAMWNFERAETWTSPFPANKIEGITLGEGGILFVKNCGACHSLSDSEKHGPSASNVIKQYKKQHSDFSKFKIAAEGVLEKPEKPKRVLKSAAKKFGPKPKMKFQKDELDKILSWLWETYTKTH